MELVNVQQGEGFPIPTKRIVKPTMFANAWEDAKIFRCIIRGIEIDVMNTLSFGERPAKNRLHDDASAQNVPIRAGKVMLRGINEISFRGFIQPKSTLPVGRSFAKAMLIQRNITSTMSSNAMTISHSPNTTLLALVLDSKLPAVIVSTGNIFSENHGFLFGCKTVCSLDWVQCDAPLPQDHADHVARAFIFSGKMTNACMLVGNILGSNSIRGFPIEQSWSSHEDDYNMMLCIRKVGTTIPIALQDGAAWA
jgi:hypothetical protein